MVFDFLWDLYQQRQIGEAKTEVQGARQTSERAERNLREFEDRAARLALINRAMWELIAPRLGYTDQHLAKKMQEIDLRDGVADGKMTGDKVQTCPKCARQNARGKLRCMYCGEAFPML